MCGDEAFDSNIVIPLIKLNEIYGKLGSEEKAIVRRTGEDHGNILYKVDATPLLGSCIISKE